MDSKSSSMLSVPKEHSLPSADDNLSYWTNYTSSTPEKQRSLRESPDFIKYVWAGIPSQYRSKVWCNPFDSPTTRFTADEPPESFKNEVDPEITFVLPRISSDSNDSTLHTLIRTVLLIDAGIYSLDNVRPGSVELVACMQDVTQQVSFTLQVYQWLAHRMAGAWATETQTQVLEDWGSAITEALSRWAPSVASTLSQGAVDSHDMALLSREWAASLLAARFPADIVRRCIDIALLDPAGADALLCVVFGLVVAARVKGPEGRPAASPSPSPSPLASPEEAKAACLSPPAEKADKDAGDSSVLRDLLFMHTRAQQEDLRAALAIGYGCCRVRLTELLPATRTPANLRSLSDQTAGAQRTAQATDRLAALLRDIRNAAPQRLARAAGSQTVASPQHQAQLQAAATALSALTLQANTATPHVHAALAEVTRLLAASQPPSAAASPASAEGEAVVSLPPLYAQHPAHTDPTFVPRRVAANGMIKYSELLPHLELPCAHMEGYLLKTKNPFEPPTDSNLCRRFFTLNGPFLTIFKTHLATAPLKDLSIDLRGRTVCVVDGLLPGHYALEVYTHRGALLYSVFAASERDRKRWAVSLVHAAHMPRYVTQQPQ